MKTRLMILLLCSCLGGCGGGSSSGSFSGNWQITGHSTPSGTTFTGTGAVQQNGSSLSGTIALTGSPCATSAKLSGSASGANVTFQLEVGDQPVAFTGTVNSDLTAISGSYKAPTGGCTNGDFGTWSATTKN